MKIRMKTPEAGPDGVFAAGTVRDVTKAHGLDLIKAHAAEEIIETATVDAPENTAARDPGPVNRRTRRSARR